MHDSEYVTVVRALCVDAQLRRVSDVQEWRVEQEQGSDRLVLSITTGPDSVRSFLVANVDALDIAEVLNRRAQPSLSPNPSLSPAQG